MAAARQRCTSAMVPPDNAGMASTVLLIFGLVYVGMILGGLPFLQLDRTGIALLGAIAVIGSEALSVEEAAQAIHLPTLILLFAFMVVSAQMRLGGCSNKQGRGDSFSLTKWRRLGRL